MKIKNKFLFVLLSFIPICSQAIRSNAGIYQNNNTTLSNGTSNNLKDSDDENIGADLEIRNDIINKPENAHASYELQFDTYESDGTIINVRTKDLDIKSATYLITNQLYLSKTNNYTFQINVNHTSWQNITINRNSIQVVGDFFSSIKITEYTLQFDWIFNPETQTFQLEIYKYFSYNYTFTYRSTGFTSDAYSSAGKFLVNPSQYSYNYTLPPNNTNNDFYKGLIPGLVVIAFALIVTLVSTILYATWKIRTKFNSNRRLLLEDDSLNMRYISKEERLEEVRDTILEDKSASEIIDSHDKTLLIDPFEDNILST